MSKKFVFDDVLDANVQKTKEAIANASQIIEVNSEAEWKAHPKYGDSKVIFWIKSGNYIADAAGVKYEDTNVAAELSSIKENLTDLNAKLSWKENGFGQNVSSVNLIDSNWNELSIVVGNLNNKFNYFVTRNQIEKGYGVGLTQGFDGNNGSTYCVISVTTTAVQIVGGNLVINGQAVPADILVYSR